MAGMMTGEAEVTPKIVLGEITCSEIRDGVYECKDREGKVVASPLTPKEDEPITQIKAAF